MSDMEPGPPPSILPLSVRSSTHGTHSGHCGICVCMWPASHSGWGGDCLQHGNQSVQNGHRGGTVRPGQASYVAQIPDWREQTSCYMQCLIRLDCSAHGDLSGHSGICTVQGTPSGKCATALHMQVPALASRGLWAPCTALVLDQLEQAPCEVHIQECLGQASHAAQFPEGAICGACPMPCSWGWSRSIQTQGQYWRPDNWALQAGSIPGTIYLIPLS